MQKELVINLLKTVIIPGKPSLLAFDLCLHYLRGGLSSSSNSLNVASLFILKQAQVFIANILPTQYHLLPSSHITLSIMFRRLPNQLPRDPDYPSDLTKLGLFINSAHQLKQIDYPEDAYRFSVTTNERYNEVREEAVNNCLCEELVTRLSKLGVESLWLPSLSNDKPDVSDVPTLPVLATQLSKLRVAKRVIVVVGKLTEDLGVWNWKSVRGEAGVEAGTVISFVKDLMGRSFESKINEVEEDDGQSAEAANGTAFLMPNPGQLLYSYNHNSAMTLESWTALSRPSALHQAPLIDEKMNRVEGSETAEKHLNYVFEKVVMNKNFVSQDAKIFLVGLNDGADQLLKMLEENCSYLLSSI